MTPVNSWRKQWMFWLALALLALPLLACSLPSAIERSVRAEENTPTPVGVPPTPGTVSTIPTVQLAPDAGEPGASVTVSGQNWQPSGTVLLRFENPNTGEGQQAVF